MRQKTRNMIIFIAFLLFPLTMNYLSPYVSIDAAMLGIVSGSLLLFVLLFISSMIFGRLWCSWACPMAGLSEFCTSINQKNVNIKKLRIFRYIIFACWAGFMIAFFVLAGGIKGVNPIHLTESFISVDMPLKFITYYTVVLLFFVLTSMIGKRGACHAICWMAPFMVAGMKLGKLFRIPRLHMKANKEKCVSCGVCTKNCPMSLPVSDFVQKGNIHSTDCILCGKCADHCNKKVLQYSLKK